MHISSNQIQDHFKWKPYSIHLNNISSCFRFVLNRNVEVIFFKRYTSASISMKNCAQILFQLISLKP